MSTWPCLWIVLRFPVFGRHVSKLDHLAPAGVQLCYYPKCTVAPTITNLEVFSIIITARRAYGALPTRKHGVQWPFLSLFIVPQKPRNWHSELFIR